MNERKTVTARAWDALRGEPLLWLGVLGLLLYGLWTLAAPASRETVRIEEATFRALEDQQAELLGRELTGDERQELREAFIDDEVLLREALRRGLHLSDARVRRRLTQIMRGALTETVADPSVAQLQAYFRDYVDRYTSPPSASLEQVLFPWGENVSDEEIAETLGELSAGADPARYASPTPLVSSRLPRQSRADLVRVFGADFADATEQLPAGPWHGPIESLQGIHLVRVVERHPPETATFEMVEPYLRQDWIMTRTRKLQQEGIDEIRTGYRIEVVDE